MTTTDLKRGDFAEHPEKGRGYVQRGGDGRLRVAYASQALAWGCETDFDLTGWERVETVRPGHVQVRVDDLDQQTVSGWSQWTVYCTDDEALVRVGRAMIASQVQHGDPSQHWPAESTPPADEQPASTTVTLPCPDCGEAITREVRPVRMEFSRTPKWSLEFLRRPGAVGERSHACPPAQPDEPQEFGAKATVAQADGHIERWLNMHAPPQGRRGWLTWDARDTAGSTPGQSKWADWGEIIQRGTVTLGWDE